MNQTAVYGTQGSPDPNNVPSARVAPATWTDSSGNLWLFGGYISATATQQGDYNDLWKYSAGQWTWVGGSNSPEQPGTYGTQGTPVPGNVPGARYEAASWTDASGDFWLFGGLGIDSNGTRGYLNDLWKYSPTTKLWTWVSGSNLVDQTSSCVGNPGVYGNQGSPASGNTPGSRVNAATGLDRSGTLWLFGGFGCDSIGQLGLLNDLWKFDPTTNMWTWINGPSTYDTRLTCPPSEVCSGFGTYGTMGVAAPGNHPGARTGAAAWTDASGNLWLFGGGGNDVNGIRCQEGLGVISCVLNDLWKYDSATNMWTWMGGSNVIAQNGVYGTQRTPASGNFPGARWLAVRWTDATGKFWLFGGEGFDSLGTGGGNADLNDLWKYDPMTNMWMWVSGSAIAGQLGIYGQQGTPAPGNIPGAREFAVGWIDKSGNLWLFGGFDPWVPGGGKFNDLWKYQP